MKTMPISWPVIASVGFVAGGKTLMMRRLTEETGRMSEMQDAGEG